MVVVVGGALYLEQEAETSCVPTLLFGRLWLIFKDLHNTLPHTTGVRFFGLTDFRPRESSLRCSRFTVRRSRFMVLGLVLVLEFGAWVAANPS
jgi:hypothetical protein